MEISQTALVLLYCYAFLLGLFLGAVYDCFRITRIFFGVHYSRSTAKRLRTCTLPLLKPKKERPHKKGLGILMFFEDLLFSLLAGSSLVLLLYEQNNGKFRFLVVVFLLLGFVIYRETLGRMVMLFSEGIAFVCETALRYLFFFLGLPIRFVCGRLARFFAKLYRKCKENRLKHRRKARTAQEKKNISVNGCGLLPSADRTKRREKVAKKGTEKAV